MHQKFGNFKKKQYLCIVKQKEQQNDNKTESESS